MLSDVVLHECDDTPRPDTLHISGPPEDVARLTAAAAERYKEKPLSLFSKKRIVLSYKKDIIVSGEDPVISTADPTSAIHTVESAAVLVQKWGYGFYHFVNEMLPKILRVHERSPTIPIVTFYNGFIRDILRHLSITNPILPYEGTPYRIKNAVHVTDTASGNPTPNDIDLIRKHAGISDTRKRDLNILIYRRENKRNIRNLFDLRDELKRRFPQEKWIVFDSMPFEETVKTFQRAKIIIGAHGAGLSNMIFAPKGTPIIEISPSDMFNACFWHLSWTLGNTHYLIASKSSDPPTYTMNVDIDSVASLVETLLK